MRIIVEKLKNNSTNPLLLEAANFLNSSAYKSFLTQYEDSVNYQVQEEDDGTFIVYRIGFSHSPRRFKERTSRCTCKIAVAYEQQCKHEIVLNNGFQKSFYSRRWERRSNLTMSRDKGDYKNPKCCKQVSIDEDILKYDKYNNDDDEENIQYDPTEDHESNSNDHQFFQDTLKKEATVKGLNYTEMIGVASKLHNASQRNPKMHVLVSGFMLKMLDEVQKSSNTESSDDSPLEHRFSALISNYR